jgi:hypothetical protein
MLLPIDLSRDLTVILLLAVGVALVLTARGMRGRAGVRRPLAARA